MTKQDVAKLSRIEARLAKLQRRADGVATALAMKSKAGAVSALIDGPRRMPAGEYRRLASRLFHPEPARPRREQQSTDSDNRLSESGRR